MSFQENFQLVSQLLSNVSGLGTTLERQETRAPMVYIKHGKIMKMSRRNIQDRFIFLVSSFILCIYSFFAIAAVDLTLQE